MRQRDHSVMARQRRISRVTGGQFFAPSKMVAYEASAEMRYCANIASAMVQRGDPKSNVCRLCLFLDVSKDNTHWYGGR